MSVFYTDRQSDEGFETQQDGSDGRNKALKKLAKEKKVSEDEEIRALEEVRKMTGEEIRRIEELLHRKEAEGMQV